jgi:hypothetical protein
MSAPRIAIEQQAAEIGINNTPAKMRITKHQLRMKIKSENARMEIDRKAPTFRINRKKINSESGLKGPSELTMAFRDAGRAAALSGARIAKEDGNFLGNLKEPGDRVARLAHTKALQRATKKRQTNIGLMPKSLPEVEWDKGYIRVNWSKHQLIIDFDGEYLPQVSLEPRHSVEIYLRTKPYFRVMVEEGDVPSATGNYVDQAI